MAEDGLRVSMACFMSSPSRTRVSPLKIVVRSGSSAMRNIKSLIWVSDRCVHVPQSLAGFRCGLAARGGDVFHHPGTESPGTRLDKGLSWK